MDLANLFRLAGKTAIVTGGERGIGLEIAVGFANAGADIVIAGMLESEFEHAAELVRRENVRCLCVPTDVSDEESVRKMVRQVQKHFQSIDILVNNAGTNSQHPAESMPLEAWKKVIDVNLTGVFLVSREVGSVMIAQKRGSIVNIASMSGLIVNPLPQVQCHYNASKAGVIMLTKCLAAEWADKGVRVNAIAPGIMRTPLTAKRLSAPGDPVVEKWIANTPMHRVGTPDELLGIALCFAGDTSSFTTGAILPVDGGYTCW